MARMSIRAAGRATGVRHSYLVKLVKVGRIPRGEDGLIELVDVEAARAQSDPAQQRKPVTKAGHPAVTPKAKRSPAPVTTSAEAVDAVALVARVLAEEGIASDGPPDLQMARLCEVILKSRDRSLRSDERRKILVPKAATIAHFARAFTGVKRQFQGAPSRYAPEMAGRLGIDAAALHGELDRMIAAVLTELSAPVP